MMQLKVTVCGASGVGKHHYCSRFLTAEFEKRHVDKATVYPVNLTTSFGETCMNLHVSDSSDNEPSDNFYLGSNAGILMFDVTSRASYKNLPEHYRNLVRCCDNIPIVLVGNKVESRDRTVKPKVIMFHRKKNLQYYEISSKANYNLEKPLLWLLRRLTNNVDLSLAFEPALAPPEVTMSEAQKSENERMLMQASAVPLPDEDDDL